VYLVINVKVLYCVTRSSQPVIWHHLAWIWVKIKLCKWLEVVYKKKTIR